jgi:N-methylhydantoinase B/oxoprolinase/acetone carboxylase alpha subunit
MNHRPEVEGMDTVNTGMGEDRMTELEVVERESEGVVLTWHWTGDGAVRHR